MRHRETAPKSDGKNFRKMIEKQQFKIAKGAGAEEAARRFKVIEVIYQDLQKTGHVGWNRTALEMSKAIAKGGSLVDFVPPQGEIRCPSAEKEMSPEEYAKFQERLKVIKRRGKMRTIMKTYTSVEFDAHNPLVKAVKNVVDRQLTNFMEEYKVINNNAQEELIKTDGTLHKSLIEYQSYRASEFTENGKVNQTGHFIDGLIRRILKNTEDIHLSKLNFSKCQSIVDYFRNRPDGLEKETCAKTIQILMRFLLWLKKSSSYGWKIDNLDEIDKKVKSLPSDREKLETIKVVSFSQLEIHELIKNSTDTELALILLGLNCGYGAGESGRLTTQHLYLDQEHPEAEKLQDLKSFGIQNWIRMKRPKNNVLNAQLLWPETAEAIKNLGVSDGVIFRTSTGAPMYRENSKNAQSTFSNYFRRLLEQCDTKSLSFGKLRKHFSTWLRNKGESELASMAVQHGNPTEDKLLHHYSNKPYKRYFEAQVEYRLYLGIEEAVRNRGLKD